MKGTIVCCLADMVEAKFGREIWQQVLTESEFGADKKFTTQENIDDAVVLQLITAVCEKLGITAEQAADAFGDFWMNDYAPKTYSIFIKKNKDARSFLQDLGNIHFYMTKTMKDAAPPRFHYEEPDENSLVMEYMSDRGLFPIFLGLVKGVGRYFNEKIEIEKLGENKVLIRFIKG